MNRRRLLRTVGAALSASVGGVAATTAGSAAQSGFDALGRVGVSGATEAVVGDDGETAYVAATDGFATVDVRDPTDPVRLDEVRDVAGDHPDGPLFSVLDVKVDGDRLLVSGPAQDGQLSRQLSGFAIYDVSDPAAPVQVGDFYETAFPIHNAYLEDDHVYLTSNDIRRLEGDEGNAGSIALVIVDVTDEPAEVGRWSLVDHDERWTDVNPYLRYLHDVYVQDGWAYLPQWDAGTYVVDVNDPADPSYVTHVAEHDREDLADDGGFDWQDEYVEPPGDEYVEPPGNDHYAMPGDDGTLLVVGREAWAASADSDGGPAGIDLYDVSDPGAPNWLSRIEPPETDEPTRNGTWTTAHNFDVVGDRLYSSWYQGGVKIHDISDPEDPVEVAAWRDDEETSFWTAKLARPGEFFVASSRDQGETFEGLYTFPDEGGEGSSPPDDGTDGENGIDGENGTGAGSETSVETGAGNETPATTGTEPPEGASTDSGATDGIPGFGGVTALVALALGAATAAIRRSGGDGT